MLTWPSKDAVEVLPYAIDWTPRLAGDTIATSLWEVPIGIEKLSDAHSTTATTIYLSNGVNGQRYQLRNTITLNIDQNIVMTQSVTITVLDR